jgi:polysaccharide export outer membrane protein
MMQRKPKHIQRQSARIGRGVVVAICCWTVVVSACASGTQGAIPIDKAPPETQRPGGEYVIGAGDLLNIQVFEQEKISGPLRVRSDGRITVPLINEIEAAGKTTAQLKTELEAALKSVILVPQVTITVVEQRPVEITVLGEVNKQGPLQLQRGSGLAQALAAAGGLTTFADRDKIFVIRGTNRYHVTYEAITRAAGRAGTFQLQSGDVINVE